MLLGNLQNVLHKRINKDLIAKVEAEIRCTIKRRHILVKSKYALSLLRFYQCTSRQLINMKLRVLN